MGATYKILRPLIDELYTRVSGIVASAVTSVTGAAPITSTGGVTPVIGITPATDLAAGSMSAADKTKLDGIAPGAAVASVSGAAPITSTGGFNPIIGITPATELAAGSMSAADKKKLDGLTEYSVVLRPSGVAGGNVFTDWASLYTAMSGVQGGVRVTVDDSLVQPADHTHMTAGGPYALNGWTFVAQKVYGIGTSSILLIDDGATIDPNSIITLDENIIVGYVGLGVCQQLAAGDNAAWICRTGTELDCSGAAPASRVMDVPAGANGSVVLEDHAAIGNGPPVVQGHAGGSLALLAFNNSTLHGGAFGPGSVATALYDSTTSVTPGFPVGVVQTLISLAKQTAFTASVPGNWVGAAPTNVEDAINRIASYLVTKAPAGPIP